MSVNCGCTPAHRAMAICRGIIISFEGIANRTSKPTSFTSLIHSKFYLLNTNHKLLYSNEVVLIVEVDFLFWLVNFFSVFKSNCFNFRLHRVFPSFIFLSEVFSICLLRLSKLLNRDRISASSDFVCRVHLDFIFFFSCFFFFFVF